MFLKYYNLREQPFGVTPNPRYLYQSASHREALASLIYGIESETGFAALIAEPGMGKTTLLFYLLERFRQMARTALIFQTQCSSRELMRYLLAELDEPVDEQDPVLLHERFKNLLVRESRAGRRVLVVIDEAQNLSSEVLETVRLLSDFETPDRKLLHIILAGQPQLAHVLAQPDLAQLLQRISILSRLTPFTVEETNHYIEYRLQIGGYDGPPIFTDDAVERITTCSRGVPREINRICFNALSLGCALQKPRINGALVDEVGSDLDITTLLLKKARSGSAVIGESFSSVAEPNAEPAMEKPQPAAASVSEFSFVSAAAESVSQPAAPITSAPAAAKRPQPSAVTRPVAPPPAGKPLNSPISPPAIRAAMQARAAHPLRREKPRLPLPVVTAVLVIGLMLAGLSYRVIAGRPAATATPSAQEAAAPSSPQPAETVPQLSAPATEQPAPPAQDNPSAASTRERRGRTSQRSSLPERSAGKGASRRNNRTGSGRYDQEFATDRTRTLAAPSAPVATSTPASMPPAPASAPATSAGTAGTAAAMSAPPPAGKPAEPTTMASAQPATIPMPRGTRVSEGVDPGYLVRRVQPSYPPAARQTGVQGSVVLNARIGKDGRVKDVRPIRGNPLLADAAASAVRQWVYKPYTFNGRPVETDTVIVIKFSLPQ